MHNDEYKVLNCFPNYIVMSSAMAAIMFRGNIFGVNEALHLCTNRGCREVVGVDDWHTKSRTVTPETVLSPVCG